MPTPRPMARHDARLQLILRNLPHLLAIAEAGSIHRASSRMRIAQSALSRRLAEVEAELGGLLFERLPNGVYPTTMGAHFLKDAAHLVTVLDRAIRQFDLNRSLEATYLRLGFNSASMTYPALAATLRDFRQAHPHCNLTLRSDLTEPLYAGVQSGELDLAVAYHLGDEMPFRNETLTEDRLILALPADHPLASRSIHIRDLDGVPLVTIHRGTNGRLAAKVDQALSEGGVRPQRVVEAGSAESTLNFVAAGIGLAFVNRSQSDRCPPNVVLREVQGFNVQLPLIVFWRDGGENPTLAAFIATLVLAFRSAKALPAPDHLR